MGDSVREAREGTRGPPGPCATGVHTHLPCQEARAEGRRSFPARLVTLPLGVMEEEETLLTASVPWPGVPPRTSSSCFQSKAFAGPAFEVADSALNVDPFLPFLPVERPLSRACARPFSAGKLPAELPGTRCPARPPRLLPPDRPGLAPLAHTHSDTVPTSAPRRGRPPSGCPHSAPSWVLPRNHSSLGVVPRDGSSRQRPERTKDVTCLRVTPWRAGWEEGVWMTAGSGVKLRAHQGQCQT